MKRRDVVVIFAIFFGINLAMFFAPRLGLVPRPKDEVVVEAPVVSPRLSPTTGAKPSTSGEVTENKNTNLVTIKPVAKFNLDQVQPSPKPAVKE